MKKRIGFIIAFLIIALCLTVFQKEVAAKDKPLQFNDINSTGWAWDSIYYLTSKKVINGYGGGRFGPTDPLTRGQAAAILVRSLYPEASPTSPSSFPDVKKDHIFYNEILVAAEKGIFGGDEKGKFNPNTAIDRGAVAKILAIAYDLKKGSTKANFSDVKGYWSADNIDILASNKIINGYTNGTFRPSKKVNRAEFAKMLATTLTHKDPSVWFTPVPGSANSYIPDKSKAYTFSGEDGDVGYTMRHRGVNDDKQPVWDQHHKDGTMTEVTYAEDRDMFASMSFSDHSGIFLSFDPYLTYPLFVGKTWDPVYLMMGVYDKPQTFYTITSTNATVVTPAGTFQDVIEVTGNDGITYYVAKRIGMIIAEDKNGRFLELTKIE